MTKTKLSILAILLGFCVWLGVSRTSLDLFASRKSNEAVRSVAVTAARNPADSSAAVESVAQPASVSEVSRLTPVRATLGAGSDMTKPWSRRVASSDIGSEILSLIASADPNDWTLAATLNSECARVVNLSLSPLRDDQAATIRRFHSRCGAAADSVTPLVQPGLIAKAAAAGSPLAKSFVRPADLKDGLSTDTYEAILQTLTKEALRAPWLTLNRARLESLIETLPDWHGTSDLVITASLTKAICSMGDDCTPNSLHLLTLCSRSSFALCDTSEGLSSTLRALNVNEQEQAQRLSEWLAKTIAERNLEALGLRKKQR